MLVFKPFDSNMDFDIWADKVCEWLGVDFYNYKNLYGSYKANIFRYKHIKIDKTFVGQGISSKEDSVVNLETVNFNFDYCSWSESWINKSNKTRAIYNGNYLALASNEDFISLHTSWYGAPPLYIVYHKGEYYITTDSRTLLFIPNFSLEPDLRLLKLWLSEENIYNDNMSGSCLKGVVIPPFLVDLKNRGFVLLQL